MPDRLKTKQTSHQVIASVMAQTGKPEADFMHNLPAFHNVDTSVDMKFQARFGFVAMVVTDKVFESAVSISFDRTEDHMHAIKAVFAVRLGTRNTGCRNYWWQLSVGLGATDDRASAAGKFEDYGRSLVQIRPGRSQADYDTWDWTAGWMLAQSGAAFMRDETYSLGVLGAETEDMICYLAEPLLKNRRGYDCALATLLTQIIADARDTAVRTPTKSIGPVYAKSEAEVRQKTACWTIAQDGDDWRQVVPSPKPTETPDMALMRLFFKHGVIVIGAGGRGVLVVSKPDVSLIAGEAVIDKDRACAMSAGKVATDAAAPTQHLRQEHALTMLMGSITSKRDAACDFADAGTLAGIWRLAYLDRTAGSGVSKVSRVGL